MDMNKLTDLIGARKRLCAVQDELINPETYITVTSKYKHSFHYSSTFLEDELSAKLKQEAQVYYQKKIEELNKEIEQLCQEQ